MESENCQQSQSLAPPVPPSLLPGILERLAQREARIGAQRALQALQDPAWEIRAAAARSLSTQPSETTRAALLQAAQDEHRLVRAAVIRALAKLDTPLEQWLHALNDPDWEVREMAVMALADISEPVPPSLLRAARSDASGSVRTAAAYVLQQRQDSKPGHRLQRRFVHIWLLLNRQIPLINKSIWLGTPLLLLLWCLKTLAFANFQADIHDIGLELALITTAIAAAGSAFLYGSENDTGFELTLATPTSIRLVMLCRFTLVILYNFLVAALASAMVATMHGGSWWEIVQIWLGPMLLISTLTLTFSLMISSWFALLGGILVELSQTLNFGNQSLHLTLVSPDYWHTTPIILLLATLCLVFTVLYVPRQPRLHA